MKYQKMVRNLQSQFKKFHITHLLKDEIRHADSLTHLKSKIDSEMPRIITVEVRDELSYSSSLSVNVITNVGRITTANVKETWMEP